MSSSFRFVHCADLHLGSRFKGVSSRDPAAAERMTESVFGSFSRIVDLAISEKADFMVISGDAFDEDTITPSVRIRFVEELRRSGIPCFIARGNHDPRTSWESSIPYPPNVTEFGTEPESHSVDGIDGLEVIGASFRDWHEERNLPSMMKGDPAKFTVACLHCDVDSPGADYAYSPCSLSDLKGRNVDYWALGHIHKRAVLMESPYAVYPGNIQGRKITEAGEKGAYLVTVSNGVVSELRFVPTQGFVWKIVEADITGKDYNQLVESLRRDIGKDDIVRFRFTGSGPLDSMLRLKADDVEKSLGTLLGCGTCGMIVETSPETDIEARSEGLDMTGSVIRSGRRLAASGREEILRRLFANPVAKAHRDYYESLSDAELEELADAAMRMMVAELEGSS